MTNYQKLFYWMSVADQAKIFFLTIAIITSIIGLIAFLIAVGAFNAPDDDRRIARKWVFFSWPLWIWFWSLWIFTPDKKDALFIVAGGGAMNYLSQDSTAKQIPHELLEFTKVNLQNLATDAKVQLGIQSQKDKILTDAKNMTSTEILDRMKTDTNFAKIILEK
jgi:hypothetical protein